MPITAVEVPVIETARLRLREMRPSDAEPMAESCRTWESVRYTSSIPHPYPADGAETYLEITRQGWADGTKLNFAVAEKDSDVYVGQSGLSLDPDDASVAELSYLLTPSVWGRGYATEMSRACLAYGFETIGLSRVFARIFLENAASIVVAEKLGMVWRETGPIDAPAREATVEVHWYDVTAEDWARS